MRSTAFTYCFICIVFIAAFVPAGAVELEGTVQSADKATPIL